MNLSPINKHETVGYSSGWQNIFHVLHGAFAARIRGRRLKKSGFDSSPERWTSAGSTNFCIDGRFYLSHKRPGATTSKETETVSLISNDAGHGIDTNGLVFGNIRMTICNLHRGRMMEAKTLIVCRSIMMKLSTNSTVHFKGIEPCRVECL